MSTMILKMAPSPKQLELFRARARNIAYGGARGGGKSWGADKKADMLGLRYPGINILLVRRTFGELEENHIRLLKKDLKGIARYTKQEHVFDFHNGSRIKCAYCDNDGDADRLQGQEYDVIMIDEATQLSPHQLDVISACCRGVNKFPKRIYFFCNPGGQGHSYIKRLFIDRNFIEDEKPEDYVFIPAKVYDNSALMESDPYYERRLKRLPYALREAWLNGSWDIFAGQYFCEWNRDIHVCAPFDIPAWWRYYVTLDYGLDMLAAYLIAVDEHGNAFATRELYRGRDEGEGANGLIISEAAEALLEMANGVKVSEWLAPPDLWNARQESGRSVADIFNEKGIFLTKTSNDRLDGWMATHEYLYIFENELGEKTAKLKIFPNCVNLIRVLPQLQFDKKFVNDVATEPHELTHAPDAIRGFCVYWVNHSEGKGAVRMEPKLIDKLKPKTKTNRRAP